MPPSIFTATINLNLAEKLRQDLCEQGFVLTDAPYARFSAKKKGVSCTLYDSGSLVVQGKEMAHFIEFYLEPEILGHFQFSHPDAHTNFTPRIGLDEAGKGDFFGPLCTAAVYADQEGIKQLLAWGVKDSKSMSDAAVIALSEKICSHYFHATVQLYPTKYNELYSRFGNLNRLLAWAHITTLEDLSRRTQCRIAILDQFSNPRLVDSLLNQKKLDVELTQRVRAEEDCVVAAASIVARASFLVGLKKLSEKYGINLPKGAVHNIHKTGKQLIMQHGAKILNETAKTHFKTHQEILNLMR